MVCNDIWKRRCGYGYAWKGFSMVYTFLIFSNEAGASYCYLPVWFISVVTTGFQKSTTFPFTLQNFKLRLWANQGHLDRVCKSLTLGEADIGFLGAPLIVRRAEWTQNQLVYFVVWFLRKGMPLPMKFWSVTPIQMLYGQTEAGKDGRKGKTSLSLPVEANILPSWPLVLKVIYSVLSLSNYAICPSLLGPLWVYSWWAPTPQEH